MNKSCELTLVPKLQLGNAIPREAPASRAKRFAPAASSTKVDTKMINNWRSTSFTVRLA
jgi:hypothetical protein